MDATRLRLTGTGEGFSTKITTVLEGVDSPRKVLDALQTLFPDACTESMEEEPRMGRPSNAVWTFEDVSLGVFLQQLHEQRILDTALDTMSMEMSEETTTFSIARQAAVAGKIAFPIPGDKPVGGVFRITVSGPGLEDWLQAATWHVGRSQVPRHINDDRAMEHDGEATTWV
tara:strand:- start:11226 stop:11741 length:516 start_codon:yes stop_codon:yes gene_type:complete